MSITVQNGPYLPDSMAELQSTIDEGEAGCWLPLCQRRASAKYAVHGDRASPRPLATARPLGLSAGLLALPLRCRD